MKSQFLKWAVVSSGLLLLAACSANERSTGVVTPVSASAILGGSGSQAEKAEDLANGAELLLSAEGFEQANEMADRALIQDPTNFRARLIHALLAPLVLQKGLIARLRKVAAESPSTNSRYLEIARDLEGNATSSNANNYLLTPTLEFQTEEEVQKHADATLDALNELRLFLKENKNQEITLQVPSAFMKDFATRYAETCDIKTTAAGEYELSCPPAATRRSVTLNRADFEIIQDMASFYLAYFSIPNAYDLSGLIAAEYAGRADADQKAQRLYERLMSDLRFGRLRDAQALKRVRGLGVDLVLGLRWAMANQSTLCPAGNNVPQNRVGMLINVGFCIPSVYYGKFVDSMGPYLSGKAEPATVSKASTSFSTEIYWTSLLDNPLSDLRQLGILRFGEKDNLISVGDPTLGGTFPRGDANNVLSLEDANIQMN